MAMSCTAINDLIEMRRSIHIYTGEGIWAEKKKKKKKTAEASILASARVR